MGEEAARCQFRHERLPGYQCLHPAKFEQPGTGKVCVFHWAPEEEAGKKQKTEVFNERFAKLVEESENPPHHKAIENAAEERRKRRPENEQKENFLDCRGFVFPAGSSFFNGRKVPPIDLSFATFGERASFRWAAFGGGASFDRATFGDRASFFEATFGERASFDGATFGEGASFGGARFGERASFDGATFGGGAWFGGATFGEGASFDEATFGEGASFERTKFLGSASFFKATAKGRLTFSGELNPSAPGGPHRVFPASENAAINFEWMTLEQPERVLFHSVDLQRAFFLYTDISNLNFVDVTWPQDERGNIVFLGRCEPKEACGYEPPRSSTAFKWLELQCQQLKLNYETKRNYAEAGDFHWAEMEYRRRRHWMNKERLSAVMLDAYKFLSGFGERIPRAAAVLLVSLLLAVFLQGRFGVFHAPKWVRPPGEAACVREDDRPFRILQDPPLIEDPCVDESAPWYEAYYQAGKFTLQDVTFQRPEEHAPASPFGRGLSLFMRLFFPIQVGLLLVAIKRRFRR
ncbi:MAG: pentapeptide repeat-containing protein [Nitrospinota bacterium]